MLSGLVNRLWLDRSLAAVSPPAQYGAGAQNIFEITGGPVFIDGIIEYNVTDIGGATTTTVAVCGVAMDDGAISIEGAAGDFCISPLNVGLTKVASVGVVAAPFPHEDAVGAGIFGILASVGNITVTFAGDVMAAAERYSLIVIYRKIHPNAAIV